MTKSKNVSTEVMEKALRILELFNDESIYARFEFERDSEVVDTLAEKGMLSVDECDAGHARRHVEWISSLGGREGKGRRRPESAGAFVRALSLAGRRRSGEA